MKQEIWKQVNGFEGYYEISNLGRIKSLAKEWTTGERWGIRKKEESFLKFGKSSNKNILYYNVTFCVDKVKSYFLVHRLVAKHFVDNPNNYNVVNHLDSDTTNNDSENLEWTTTKGNVLHSFEHGKRVVINGEKHGNCKLTVKQVLEIRELVEIGKLEHEDVAKMYKVSRPTITKIVRRIRWKHI